MMTQRGLSTSTVNQILKMVTKMNIFYLGNPQISAQELCDKHIVKMITESAQMLCTIHWCKADTKEKTARLSEIGLFKPAHINHPSTIWARQSWANFMWLYQHGLALCEEYKHRYGKEHGSYQRILYCEKRFGNLVRRHNYPHSGLTPVTIAMDDSYRIDLDEYSQRNPNWTGWDFVIASYRHYYLEGKWDIAEWRNNRQPEWFPANWVAKKYNVGIRAYNASGRKYPKQLMEE